ncbi:hypothetical protein LCGC14_1006030 [marine sediment metagenome]|uniref:Uncharacterized protein n=1 Tax=marine sediment metagenome TaxID=412755 RepID=A0A0F9N693_9ZZZZ
MIWYDLSYLYTLNQIEEKIIHTQSSLYNIIYSNFNDGDVLTAVFHRLSPNGFTAQTTINSKLKNYRDQFPEIKGSRLRYVVDKSTPDGEMKLRQFVGEIVYYLTVFQATVFLKEGPKTATAEDVLCANLMQLLSEAHVNTDNANNPASFHPGQKFSDILSTYESIWNRGPTGAPVWGFADLVPGYFVMQYTNEGTLVRERFNIILQLSGIYRIQNLKNQSEL